MSLNLLIAELLWPSELKAEAACTVDSLDSCYQYQSCSCILISKILGSSMAYLVFIFNCRNEINSRGKGLTIIFL